MSTTVDKAWFERAMAIKGMSMRAVAGELGVDASALSRALNGRRKFKPQEIRRLAEILQQPVTAVLGHASAAPKGMSEMPQSEFESKPKGEKATLLPTESQAATKHHPAYGALKGMITLLPDVDYTEPADPEWGKAYED